MQQSTTGPNGHVLDASPITPYAAGHYHNPLLSHPSRRGSESEVEETESNPWESSLGGVPLDERHPEEGLQESTTLQTPHTRLRVQTDSLRLLNGTGSSSVTPSLRSPASELEPRKRSKRHRVKTLLKAIFHTFFPTLYDFRHKSILGMIAALFAAPAVLSLTLTLPVVVTPQPEEGVPEKLQTPVGPTLGTLIDFEEEGIERALIAEEVVDEELHELHFNKWLMVVQCICGPLFCVSVLFSTFPPSSWVMLMDHQAHLRTIR